MQPKQNAAFGNETTIEVSDKQRKALTYLPGFIYRSFKLQLFDPAAGPGMFKIDQKPFIHDFPVSEELAQTVLVSLERLKVGSGSIS